MARIAYFYRELSEYIDVDLRLLGARHELTVTACGSRWPRPLATLRLARQNDLGLAWFASWHALAPALAFRLLGKPFAVVVGGYDTACLPGIDYGHQRGGFKQWVARAVLALATRVIGISAFTLVELRALGVSDAKVTLIPLGLDPARYACASRRDAGLVVTVGGVNRSNLTRKGLEAFVRTAALVPEARFVMIGAWADDAIEKLRALAGANVVFTNRLTHGDKVAWLARAEVVVQASQHEAFGLALAEGMLCGATPVVTNAGALPWVAGDTGVVVESQDPVQLAEGIRAALAFAPVAGPRARARVLAEFTDARRGEALERLVEQLCGPGTEASQEPVRAAA